MNCEECNYDFTPLTKRRNRRFCCEHCRRRFLHRAYVARRPKRPDIICLSCGVSVAHSQKGGRTRKFCGQRCKNRFTHQLIGADKFSAFLAREKTCCTCGNQFSPRNYLGARQKYCSQACGLAPVDARRRATENRADKIARLTRQAVNIARLAKLFRGEDGQVQSRQGQ